MVVSDRTARAVSHRRFWARRALVLSVVVLAAALWSFLHAVVFASNGDPLSANATEWARSHDLGWLVDHVEHLWYSHHQPGKGGAPTGGIARVAAPALAAPSAVQTGTCPPSVQPLASDALADEGAWRPVGRTGNSVCFAYLRPDAVHTSSVVAIAWMNMHALTATLHNGTVLPGGGPWNAGPRISPSDYPWVAAAFNSGFRLDASRGGYFTEHRTVQQLVDGRASLVIYNDGRAAVGMWGRDATASPRVASVRQNLDLIVDHGRLVDGLSDANNPRWGATLGNLIYTWRSGIGIDAEGNLIYVAGPGLNVETLAAVLQRAGAVRAMELDINPEWTSLMVYDGTTSTNITATKLLANMQRPADRYLHNGTRDFIELDLQH